MTLTAAGDSSEPDAFPHRARIFVIMTLALLTAASAVALRAATADHLKSTYLDQLDPLRASELLGSVLGTAFAGFSVTLFVASPLLHVIQIRRALTLSAAFPFAGLLLVSSAGSLATGDALYNLLILATLLQGIGWGLVEAVINPLTSALYPANRTSRLNILHAWYPAGIVVGSLLALCVDSFGLDWRWAIVPTLVGLIAVFILSAPTTFPAGEEVTSGATMNDMFRAMIRQPTIFLWFFIMTMTATTEFAPGQWVDFALSEIVGMRGILLLVYVSALMFVLRHFAGPLVKRLSNTGLLLVCSVIATFGLLGLSIANSPATALLAATGWGIGVCFFWPTMLATVAERYPRGGTLVFGFMGSAGAAATYLVLPILGKIYDQAKIAAAGGPEKLAQMTGEALKGPLSAAATASFQTVALIPAALTVIFALIALRDRRRRLAEANERKLVHV